MAAAHSPPRWRFLKLAFLFGALHFLVLLALGGIIFLVSHIPPEAVNLDAVISGLVTLEDVLSAPRKFILWAWPSERTPSLLGPFSTVLNSMTWGVGLAIAKSVCRPSTG